MNRSLIWIAALAGLLAGASLATHRRRERERRLSPAKPEPLQTWEGEGGAVPLRTGRMAQQVTPPQRFEDTEAAKLPEHYGQTHH